MKLHLTSRLLAVVIACVGVVAPSQAAAVEGCQIIRGKLMITNGTPSFRIWVVGTKRLLGLSGIGEDMDKLPPEVAAVWRRSADGPLGYRILGDFRVCALTRQRAGEMQFVRLESGKRMRLLGPDED
jgi:hypothetical protein